VDCRRFAFWQSPLCDWYFRLRIHVPYKRIRRLTRTPANEWYIYIIVV